MKNLAWKLVVLAITVGVAGLALAQTGGAAATLTKISRYRQWTKVNADPIKVEIPLMVDPALALS